MKSATLTKPYAFFSLSKKSTDWASLYRCRHTCTGDFSVKSQEYMALFLSPVGAACKYVTGSLELGNSAWVDPTALVRSHGE